MPDYRIPAGNAIGVALPARPGYAEAMGRDAKRSDLVFAVGLACLAGCFTASPQPVDPIQFTRSSETMRREVVKHIPYGTSLKKARSIMEANGFTCADSRRSRVMTCDTAPTHAHPVRVWIFYDPENTVKEVQARCD